ncbi:YegP family protein [Pseudarthrobacter sulfonivorans]|uniref:YegP family protein n=1 Tax=Pseudarthrobacter sulfonivorans TaxID=121292 RepID=UPI0021040EB1|nr:DUF1508 domain-containing protein [Pseudarthrobacter sulfonivorans]
MAGIFEVFLDADSLFRFRLKAPDGTVVAESGAFADKSAVAAGIAVTRECAGTGLITDLSAGAAPDPLIPAHQPAALRPVAVPAVPALAVSAAAVAAEPARDEQHVSVSRVRAFAHFNAVRGRVSGARWSGAV